MIACSKMASRPAMCCGALPLASRHRTKRENDCGPGLGCKGVAADCRCCAPPMPHMMRWIPSARRRACLWGSASPLRAMETSQTRSSTLRRTSLASWLQTCSQMQASCSPSPPFALCRPSVGIAEDECEIGNRHYAHVHRPGFDIVTRLIMGLSSACKHSCMSLTASSYRF